MVRFYVEFLSGIFFPCFVVGLTPVQLVMVPCVDLLGLIRVIVLGSKSLATVGIYVDFLPIASILLVRKFRVSLLFSVPECPLEVSRKVSRAW